MTQDRTTPNGRDVKALHQKVLASSYYALLGLHPCASVREIRQAYRELSKLYHPDTTALPMAVATSKFQQLNEAYATLSNPERRTTYDRKIGYSSVPVIQPLPSLHRSPANQPYQSSSAYLDPTDRPLSSGELFALFVLGITFLGCLCLAIAIGLTRSESVILPAVAKDLLSPSTKTAETLVVPHPSDSSRLESLSPDFSPSNLSPPGLIRTDVSPIPPAVNAPVFTPALIPDSPSPLPQAEHPPAADSAPEPPAPGSAMTRNADGSLLQSPT